MKKYRPFLLQAPALACVWVTASSAETATYTYDALGRLTASSVSGGTNAGTNTAICYDAAGNRVQYVSSTAGASTCVSPVPSPTPASTPSSSP